MRHGSLVLSVLATMGLAGCLDPSAHEALHRQEGSDAWALCGDALAAARSNDACTFNHSCGMSTTSDGLTTVHVTCFDGRVMRTSGTSDDASECMTPNGGGLPFTAGPFREGACVSIERYCGETEPGSGVLFSSRVLLCAEGEPVLVEGREPWELDSEADCARVIDEHALPGDPCSGEHVCYGAWEETPDSFVGMFAWCVDGELQVVPREPF